MLTYIIAQDAEVLPSVLWEQGVMGGFSRAGGVNLQQWPVSMDEGKDKASRRIKKILKIQHGLHFRLIRYYMSIKSLKSNNNNNWQKVKEVWSPF